MRGVNRKTFMALTAASAATVPAVGRAQPGAAVLPPASAGPTPGPSRVALAQALVLSGGGALGAYEAGAIESFVTAAGVAEGEPLAPYGLICGTSIGALNAFFVATAQYAKLRSLWSTIADQAVIRLKPRYRKIVEESSGVASRLAEQIGLLQGLQRNVTGVLDGEYLRAWMLSYFDFSRPVVMPMVWSVTNLTMERPEYFYLAPSNVGSEERAIALAAARLALGPDVPIREASRAFLVDQLRASAAVPVGFDPVPLIAPDGLVNLYVDGGVTANTPVRVATALARRIDAVLLNPAFQPATIHNAVQVASGSFDTMQRQLMDNAVRSAYFESFALRALRVLPASYAEEIARLSGVNLEHLQALQSDLYQTDLFVLRPKSTLPVSLFGFQDGDALAQTYAMGKADGAAGFQRFDPITRTIGSNG